MIGLLQGTSYEKNVMLKERKKKDAKHEINKQIKKGENFYKNSQKHETII